MPRSRARRLTRWPVTSDPPSRLGPQIALYYIPYCAVLTADLSLHVLCASMFYQIFENCAAKARTEMWDTLIAQAFIAKQLQGM